MNIAKHVKPIVEGFVNFWQQEAESKKRKLQNKDGDGDGDEDEDEDEDGSPLPLYQDDDRFAPKAKKRKVYEDDLVRFVPWSEGECFINIILSTTSAN
jgi:hypothetical protein